MCEDNRRGISALLISKPLGCHSIYIGCIIAIMEKQGSLDQILEQLRAIKPEVEARYHVSEFAVFGSYRRGEQRPDSDLDILVSFQSPISLIKIIELENYLSEMLGVKVDLVMRDALKPYIGKHILKEIVAV